MAMNRGPGVVGGATEPSEIHTAAINNSDRIDRRTRRADVDHPHSAKDIS
jgi:hypothetical protein